MTSMEYQVTVCVAQEDIPDFYQVVETLKPHVASVANLFIDLVNANTEKVDESPELEIMKLIPDFADLKPFVSTHEVYTVGQREIGAKINITFPLGANEYTLEILKTSIQCAGETVSKHFGSIGDSNE